MRIASRCCVTDLQIYFPIVKVTGMQLKGKSLRLIKRGVIGTAGAETEVIRCFSLHHTHTHTHTMQTLKFTEESESLEEAFQELKTFWER